MIAEVVFDIPAERAFHYLVPTALRARLQPGMRIAAPFGPRERIGFALRFVATSPIRTLKAIRRVLDPMPVIAEERWPMASWLASFYCCSLGEALAAMVPAALRLPAVQTRPGAAVGAAPEGAAAAPPMFPQQERAWETIRAVLASGRSETVLVHGVTASGKTELYLRAIAEVLSRGRSAIYLIPEISLTPQAIDRFLERFGGRIAVWHSRLTAKQRGAEWLRLATGAARVVVGARSAVFAPLRRLGLIILDEEHDAGYKQEATPRYHARTVAQARARLTGATVLLGSATPSIESYDAAARGRGRLVILPERVEGRSLPEAEIIDMREELARRHRPGPLSSRLERALQRAVERGEQAMLLLNRRGFARSAQCKVCGDVKRCADCAVPLIYHASPPRLVCHYCNAGEAPEERCRRCRNGSFSFRGSGTERIESELHRLFPAASIARMDRDTTKGRERHREIYEALKGRHIGLLVGTQMIAKGHDFPQVTLVGVVSADTSLNLPDFRSGERTFDLLTQAAGRAGRGERPGQVLIQTYCPDHYAIQAAARQDYRRFYDEEIAMRRRLKLPPFSKLVELTLAGSSRPRVEAAAARLAARLRRAIRGRRIALLGPAPHRVPRVRRTYRSRVLLKGSAVEPLVAIVRDVLRPGRTFEGLPVTVDVDPL